MKYESKVTKVGNCVTVKRRDLCFVVGTGVCHPLVMQENIPFGNSISASSSMSSDCGSSALFYLEIEREKREFLSDDGRKTHSIHDGDKKKDGMEASTTREPLATHTCTPVVVFSLLD